MSQSAIPAKKAPPPPPGAAERRAHTRFELRIDMSAQILIPEETFQPRMYVGASIDVSRSGLKVRLEDMHIEDYKKLLSRTRYIRLTFISPLTRNEVKVTGRVMWIDYHKRDSSTPRGPCIVGVFFDPREGGDLTDYRAIVDAVIPQE